MIKDMLRVLSVVLMTIVLVMFLAFLYSKCTSHGLLDPTVGF
jgi:hypothetical protein